MVAVITLTVGVEGGLFTWLTTFAAGRLPESLAPVVLSVLLVAYIPGRFTAGRLAERVGYVTLALALVLVCLAATLYTFFLATGFGLAAGLFVVGFSLSGLYPTLLAYATEAVPEHSAALNAIALVVGAVAIAGVPFAMGFVIDASGVVTAMRLLVLPLAAMALVVGAIRVRA